jgi:ribosomal protein S8
MVDLGALKGSLVYRGSSFVNLRTLFSCQVFQKIQNENISIYMSFNSQTADIASRFSNAFGSKSITLKVFKTKISKNILSLMLRIGLINSYEISNDNNHLFIVNIDQKQASLKMKLVSKPGGRLYLPVESIKSIIRKKQSPYIFIISTSLGLMTAQEAVTKNVGGELLFELI